MARLRRRWSTLFGLVIGGVLGYWRATGEVRDIAVTLHARGEFADGTPVPFVFFADILIFSALGAVIGFVVAAIWRRLGPRPAI